MTDKDQAIARIQECSALIVITSETGRLANPF